MTSMRWVILGFGLLGLLIGQFIVPLDFGPDEPMHMEYIHVLAYEGRLPTRQETHIVQHPPVYYALMAIPWRLLGAAQRPLSVEPGPRAMQATPASAQVARRVLRVLQTLLMCSALWMMAQVLLLLKVPVRLALLWLGIAAVWPMMGYVAGVVNNENATIAWSALLCLTIVKTVLAGRVSTREVVFLGLLCGAGVLIKQTTLFAVPIALWAIWNTSAPRSHAKHISMFLAAFLALAVWWPLHNYLVAGHPFPSYTTPADQFALPLAEKLVETPGTLRLIFETSFLPDWATRILPRTISLFAVLCLGAAVALLAVSSVIHRRKTVHSQGADEATRSLQTLQLMSVCAFACLVIGILQYVIFKDYMGQIGGRYLLNGMPWILALCGSSYWLLGLKQARDSETVIQEPAPSLAVANSVANISLGILILYALLASAWWFLAWSYYDALIHGL